MNTKIEPCPGLDVPGRKKEHCGKVPAKGSVYCPKHVIYAAEMQSEVERRMEKARAGKERKKAQRDALKDSPLKAYNPNFDDKHWQAYSQ